MTANYRIGDIEIDGDSHGLTEVLARAYADKIRPICLCRSTGVEMYLAKIGGSVVVKRMPGTGGDHAADCESYEPPHELSGLGQIAGRAITEDPSDGLTSLKVGFSLTKTGSRSPAGSASGSEADSAKTDGTKLTLRSLLHYLWEEAGFNRWSPSMTGKRSWAVVWRHLRQVVERTKTKGAPLADSLYVPEPFHLETKDEIAQRRLAFMSRSASSTTKGARRLMIVVGEVKEFAPARFGHKVLFRHAPDFPFMLPDDLHKRLHRRFEAELSLWQAMDSTHLMAIATFGVAAAGVATLEEVALMLSNENWIPFDGAADRMLIEAMTRDQRRFTKGLRYNLAPDRPMACMVATDTQPQPTAMFVLPTGDDELQMEALRELMADSKLASWTWLLDEEMPTLPECMTESNKPTHEAHRRTA